ncbi:P2Y purinoceptor 13-like [Rhinatrema bivittatum]|uniref:P2Y purinoceptor 13-like n=1 Tax=Rhinatrema bivittatum TaxID=194408 RepID=UPI0011285655|nr:P2Y purinoceptor 13-like [Rhinatrema bivittatum]
MSSDIFNISNGSSPFPKNCQRDISVQRTVFPALYTCLFFAGISLNGLSVWIFFRIPSTSIFIVYLKNTLVADLIMTLLLPFKILTDAGLAPWQLKAFVCRFSAVIFYETMYVSIILLGLIGLDRCLKIVKPFGKKWLQNVSFAKILSMLVWLFMFSLSLPNIILSNQTPTPSSVKKCASLKNQLGLKWHEAVNYICQFIFWTVFILMVLVYSVIAKKVYESYTKSKSRNFQKTKSTTFRVFIIVAVFFICFSPFHFTRVPYTLSQTGSVADCKRQNQLFIAKESTLWIATANICLDPLIYIFLCKPFRKMLAKVTRRRYISTTMETDTPATHINHTTV